MSAKNLKNRLLLHVIAKKNVFMPLIWLWRAENSSSLKIDSYTYGTTAENFKMAVKNNRMMNHYA